MELAFDANVTIEDTLSTPNILFVIGQRNIYLVAKPNYTRLLHQGSALYYVRICNSCQKWGGGGFFADNA